MTLYLIRIFVYTLLPLLAAWVITYIDPRINTHFRKLEVYLIFLFGFGVAGGGFGNFFGHFFVSDAVAKSIGWEPGSPFQLEMAFANLTLGVLGLIATGRRDGFREATVIAVTVLGVGATIVHFMDIIQSGNLAPGNTIQNIGNLLKPALLIGFLRASRRAEKEAPERDDRERWREPHLQAVGWLTGMVLSGFGAGFFLGRLFLGTGLGILAGALMIWLTLGRARKTAVPGT